MDKKTELKRKTVEFSDNKSVIIFFWHFEIEKTEPYPSCALCEKPIGEKILACGITMDFNSGTKKSGIMFYACKDCKEKVFERWTKVAEMFIREKAKNIEVVMLNITTLLIENNLPVPKFDSIEKYNLTT